MRIAVVTHYFPTSADPWAGQSAYQTLRVLSERHDVRVFVPEATYPRLLTPPGARRAPLDRAWTVPGVAATYIPYTVLPVISRPLNGFMIAHELLSAVRDFRPDIILNYVVYPNGFAAVRIAKKLGVPVVLTAIGSDLNRIADPLCRIMTRSALRGADFVTTVSHDLAKTAQSLGADSARTKAILNGCDTSVFRPQNLEQARLALGIPLEEETVLYVGRLDLKKGLMELIEAAAALHARRPAMRVYIMGNGPDEAALQESITRHGAADYVKLLAPRSSDQVAQWMAAADLVTLPSYNEGCPNVVIEALAAGRPVVATNVGGIPELMDERSGRLVLARDAAALAEGLDQVLSTAWDAAAISSLHARSWPDVARDLETILTSTLQASRH